MTQSHAPISDRMVKLGAAIAELRESFGWTQKQVASKFIGKSGQPVSDNRISEMEHGEVDLDKPEVRSQLRFIYGPTVDALYDRVKDPDPVARLEDVRRRMDDSYTYDPTCNCGRCVDLRAELRDAEAAAGETRDVVQELIDAVECYAYSNINRHYDKKVEYLILLQNCSTQIRRRLAAADQVEKSKVPELEGYDPRVAIQAMELMADEITNLLSETIPQRYRSYVVDPRVVAERFLARARDLLNGDD